MNAAGLIRFRKWEAGGKKGLKPLTDCIAAVFLDVQYYKGDMVDSALERRLREIDPQFEIIYDRCTTSHNMEPGFHLYRRVKGLPETSGRQLKLEFSLQKDCNQPWPLGGPREPGPWVIDEIRKTDKANLSGDKEKADAMAIKAMQDHTDAEDAAADAAQREQFIEFNKAIQPVMQERVAVGLSTTNERKPRGRPKKIQVKL